MKIYLVYIIRNSVNEKVYIGVTCNGLKYRFNQHIRHAYQNVVVSHLYKAIRKYGKDSFSASVLDVVIDEKQAYRLEIKRIDEHDSFHNGYNMTEGGEVGWSGPKSEEHKRKIGAAQ